MEFGGGNIDKDERDHGDRSLCQSLLVAVTRTWANQLNERKIYLGLGSQSILTISDSSLARNLWQD